SIIDEVGFPADQGVNLFKLGVRHLKTGSCLENTDRELKTIADCVKLLRAREVPLDDAPMPASRPKSRAGSASDTASTYTSQSEASSDRTPPRSPRHNRRGSRVSFDEPSTVERLLATLLDQQKEFVAHIERSDRHHQSLMDGHGRDNCYRKNLRWSVCREVGHYAGEHARTCNICKKVGHVSSRCPEKTAP
ncbi:unnamed protein product, partial [Aphanomyces euteiches]